MSNSIQLAPKASSEYPRLSRLADMLAAHVGQKLAIEHVANELGVSRASVRRGLAQLQCRRMQLAITDQHCMCAQPPDLLLPSLLAEAGHTTSNTQHRFHHYFRIGSTQDAAQAAAAAGAEHGSVFVAEEQTAGRGRQNRKWHSPASTSIAMSMVLRPAGAPARMLPLTLGCALAVADAVENVTGAKAEIRWPNDLLVNEKKFCGILLESSAEATRIQYAVLGIGINVNQPQFPADLAPIATSLRLELGRPVHRIDLLANVLRQIDRRYAQFAAGGPAALLNEFEQRSTYARGRHVRVGSGPESYTGTTAGVDAVGFLRVRRDDNGATETVITGEVRPAH